MKHLLTILLLAFSLAGLGQSSEVLRIYPPATYPNTGYGVLRVYSQQQAIDSLNLILQDFDIAYLPSLTSVSDTNGIIYMKDLNGLNTLSSTFNSLSPIFINNSALTLHSEQFITGQTDDKHNFDIDTNDLYIAYGARLSKHQYKTTSVMFYCGGTSNTNGGYHFQSLNSDKDTYQFWFTISPGDGSPRQYAFGAMDSCWFDDKYHLFEFILDRNVGTKVYVDGDQQTVTDNTVNLYGDSIYANQKFTIGGYTSGTSNQTTGLLAIKKSIPSQSVRNTILNNLNPPFNDWRLNTYFNVSTISKYKIHLIKDESVTIYGDALLNVPIENNLEVYYDSEIGTQTGNNYAITPTTSGTFNLPVRIYDNSIKIDGQTISIEVNDKINTGSVSIMLVGNSLVLAGGDNVFNELESIFDGITWSSIGTVNVGGVLHEGRSGKTYNWFVHDTASPFVNPSGDLDFNAYFTDNSLSIPDIVHVRLGVNDVIAQTSGEFERTEIYSIINDVKLLIDSLLAYDAGLKIIVSVPTICENSGAGWAANYPGNPYQDTYIEYIHFFWQEIVSRFYNPIYDSRVYISYEPIFLDRDLGYPKVDGVHTNGVHPNGDGYIMLAKGLAGVINKILQP